jgi:hypothetical protein
VDFRAWSTERGRFDHVLSLCFDIFTFLPYLKGLFRTQHRLICCYTIFVETTTGNELYTARCSSCLPACSCLALESANYSQAAVIFPGFILYALSCEIEFQPGCRTSCDERPTDCEYLAAFVHTILRALQISLMDLIYTNYFASSLRNADQCESTFCIRLLHLFNVDDFFLALQINRSDTAGNEVMWMRVLRL